MITEDYCSKDLYKLLLEKGFDGEVQTTYDEEGYTQSSISLFVAMKWLREIHKLCIVIEPVVSDDDGDAGCLWSYRISKYTESIGVSPSIFTTYVETTEEAIKYSLKKL